MSLFQVKISKIIYSETPADGKSYTREMDKYYNIMSKFYNMFMILFPLWKKWISSVLPHISGHKILEVSFGPGYLLEKCAAEYECHGIDYNKTMVDSAGKRLARKNLTASLIQANVESLPYENNSFDCLINTMAFTGYPDGKKALREMMRVLKPGGKLLIVDFDYPQNRNIFGYSLVKIMDKSGDLIKDFQQLFESQNLKYTRETAGGFGSVYLYIITKEKPAE